MIVEDPVFLTLGEVIEIHRDQIERYGGDPGIRDLGLLQSAMAVPAAGFGGRSDDQLLGQRIQDHERVRKTPGSVLQEELEEYFILGRNEITLRGGFEDKGLRQRLGSSDLLGRFPANDRSACTAVE
jgi:hypothetical protein